METGILFHTLLRSLNLRSLNLRTYMAPARSRLRDVNNVPIGPFSGISHLVQIVTLPDNTRYALDVCFGGDGPTKPMPLESCKIIRNLGAQEVRLVNRHLDEHRDTEGQLKSWVYEYRNSVEREWAALYSFGECEFLVSDFEAINFGVSNDGASFQTFTVIAVKFLLAMSGGDEGEDEGEGDGDGDYAG